MEKAAATNGSQCQGKIHLGLGFSLRAAYGPGVLLALFSHPTGGQIWDKEAGAGVCG